MNPNPYDTENTVHIVDGYFIRHPNESAREAFERAKAEALPWLRQRVTQVESLTFEQFENHTKQEIQ